MSSTIPTNQTQDSDIANEMANDNDNDNNIVNEIINEMGTEQKEHNNDNNESQYQMDQENHFNRQVDPSQNMMPPDDINQYGEDIEPEYNNIEVKASSGFSKDIILKNIKEPLVVTVLAVLLNNPMVSKLLVKYLPVIFNTTSGIKQYLGVTIKALIAGVLYYIIKALLLK